MTTEDARRRKLREQYNSDRFWPLTREQAVRFREAANNARELKERFVGLTLLYTGMRNGELCHMRRNWVASETKNGEDLVKVTIPVAELCTGGTGPTGKDNAKGANLHQRGTTCAPCRRQDRDHWTPKTANGSRLITVKEPDAVEVIRNWFDHHEDLPLMHNSVNRRIERIADRAEIQRNITAHDLRDTFATILVRKGFNRHPIRALMGHNDIARLNDYFEFVGTDQEKEFFEKW